MTPLEKAAKELAWRCCEFVGGQKPADPMMNADQRIWTLAQRVLKVLGPKAGKEPAYVRREREHLRKAGFHQ